MLRRVSPNPGSEIFLGRPSGGFRESFWKASKVPEKVPCKVGSVSAGCGGKLLKEDQGRFQGKFKNGLQLIPFAGQSPKLN